jgi:hypothetical protein
MKPVSKLLIALAATASALVLLGAAQLPDSAPLAAPGTVTNAPDTDPEAILEVKPAAGKLPAGFQPSESLREIVKMAQAGVSEEVLLTYIRNAGKAFHPSPEDIIFLNDLGVGEAVLKALIDSRDGSSVAAAKPAPAAEATTPAAAATAPATTIPPALNGAVARPATDAPPAPAAQTSSVIVTEPAPVTSVHYFYDSLAPYGTWLNVAGFGWCWQPTVAVVNVHWQPYCDNGRWVYSNFGWYWHSGYSWGWAPFHYGRWYRHARCGWLWVPDTVWGPSWVSWRYSSQYCGWAPLPPRTWFRPGIGFTYWDSHISMDINFDFGLSFHHYTYVPISRFCHPNPRHHAARQDEVKAIHQHTTVINNYVTGDNNTVINRGIERDRIARASRSPVPEVTVRDALMQTSATLSPARIHRDGDRDVVYRPVLGRPNGGSLERDARTGRDSRGGPPATARANAAPSPAPGGTAAQPPAVTTPAKPAPAGGRPQATPPATAPGRTASEILRRDLGRGARPEPRTVEPRPGPENRPPPSLPTTPSSGPGNSGRGPSRPAATPPQLAPATPAAPAAPDSGPTRSAPPNRVSNERLAEMIRELQSRPTRPQPGGSNDGSLNARPLNSAPARPLTPAPSTRESGTFRLPQPAPNYSPAPAPAPSPAAPPRTMDRGRAPHVPGLTPRGQSVPTPAPSPAPAPAPVPSNPGVLSRPSTPAAPAPSGSSRAVQRGGVESRGGTVSRGNGNSAGRGRGNNPD